SKKNRFLSKADVGDGLVVTILDVTKENIASPGQPPEERVLLTLKGVKPMTLNSTNARQISKIVGSQESDDWVGKKIELYNDEDVEFGGKTMGGIRVRAAEKTTRAQERAYSTPAPEPETDEIPY